MKLFVVIFAMVVALSGCTVVTVKPLDKSAGVEHVCILENPKVKVSNFLSVVEEGFDRHGISTEVISGEPPARCEHLLSYTALRTWDVVLYLHHAELSIEHENSQIGYGEYRLRGKGGFALNKFAGTKSKMNPVIDELLADYR